MLDPLFRPRSIAVIGASQQPDKLGYTILDNLIRRRFPGKLYPINPRAERILNNKAYPSILQVPDPVDLAIVAVPAPTVATVLEECGRKRVPCAIVISAGFREAGPEGAQLEEELVAIANTYQMRLLGPNCLGVINTFYPLNATFAEGMPEQWEVAIMSQSGAMGSAILDWATLNGIGFSRFVSLGNMADIDETDLLEHWLHDEQCKVIVAYLEGIADGQRFMEVAAKVTRRKPLIVLKVGTTAAGQAAILSHTGSLAGSNEATLAAFQQTGIVRAETMEQLFDLMIAFAYSPLPKGKNVAIITNAGGPGVMASDAIERSGLRLAQLAPATSDTLQWNLPPAASVHNPIDLLGDAQTDRYRLALEAVIADSEVDAVLVLLTPQVMTEPERTAKLIAHLTKSTEKPLVAVYMGGVEVSRGRAMLQAAHVPTYQYPERAARALAALETYGRYLKREQIPLPKFAVSRDTVRRLIREVRRRGASHIAGHEADRLFAAYGFPTLQSQVCRSAEEAVARAQQIGLPVVAKIVSDDIVHKSDAGGVAIGLETPEQVGKAYHEIMERVSQAHPSARLEGVMIERFVEGGKEVIVGMKRDPQFGPTLMFGLGGIYVEVFKDVTFRVAPLAPWDAREMISELHNYPLLAGVRGEPPVDFAAIEDALLRLSRLALDFPEIEEIDINPLKVFPQGQGAIGVDFRIILSTDT
ncbi:MAG: acetate--CoA ligase family protein [Chloroflexi bacterium]|nr:acetate--CoA ligase family protein [Chloroflexota bacterium]